MNVLVRRLGAGLVLTCLAPLALMAYGPATTHRMAEVTLRLAPPSLRSALLSEREQLERGISDALSDYGTAPRDQVLAEAQREFAGIPGLTSIQAPFPQVAYHFGKLAGLVYVANDPFARSGDGRAKAVRQDYMQYVERKLPLMVFAFDGYTSPPLEGDLGKYLAARMAGGGRYVESVLFCYFPPGGGRASSSTFDDRSNAFGAAQVILSHAVSDAAKAWLQVWQAMDGDLRATPYLRPADLKGSPRGASGLSRGENKAAAVAEGNR
jgi:hypothetical protein